MVFPALYSIVRLVLLLGPSFPSYYVSAMFSRWETTEWCAVGKLIKTRTNKILHD
jgi:hypothetical protein